MNAIKSLSIIAALAVSFAACSKKEDNKTTTPTPNPTPTDTATVGKVGFEFSHKAGSADLVMTTGNYTNAAGESFTVTKFNYYITNIKMIKADGSEYAEPESYHLIEGDVASTHHFHMNSVPKGSYKGISFLIGVDSTRNVSGAQTGALDPAKGMFWTWNTGYIMAKVEGTSPVATSTDKKFVHHIGGFTGGNSGVKKVTIMFPQSMDVSAAKELSVLLNTDILKWFSPSTISIASNTNIMSVGMTSAAIASNYANMITLNAAKYE
jgi:hypothetical protein